MTTTLWGPPTPEARYSFPHPGALIAAGALTGAIVVGSPPGVGVFMSVVAVAAAVATQRPRPLDRVSVVYAALAVALGLVAVLSAAPWMIALTLGGVLGLGAVAVAGGPAWAQVGAAAVAPLRTVWSGQRNLFGSLRQRAEVRGLRVSAPLARGIGLAVVLVTVFGTLFASADRAFAHLAERYLVPDWRLDLLPARVFLSGVVTAGAAALAAAPAKARQVAAAAGRRRITRVEWMIALGALDALFLVFVLVQITVLFGGHDTVLRTSGLTYAEYARQGFFQLVVAAGLTFAVIAASVRWAARRGDVDRRMLQFLLGVLCVCALVVLVSALRRLGLYEETFGFTRLRMFVHAVLLWFAVLFVLVMIAGARWRAGWLPAATVVTTAAALLVFGLLRPDAVIAEHNVRRFQQTGAIDLRYLNGLSADAVPALATLPEQLRPCVLRDDVARLQQPQPWPSLNLSRQRAREVLASTRGAASPCEAP